MSNLHKKVRTWKVVPRITKSLEPISVAQYLEERGLDLSSYTIEMEIDRLMTFTNQFHSNRVAKDKLDKAYGYYIQEGERETPQTREEWLLEFVEVIDKLVFTRAGYPIPPIRITIGFPITEGGARKKGESRGDCWSRDASTDGVNEIFLNPTIPFAKSFLSVLTHELVHAVDDCKSGHKGRFRTICDAVGMIGDPYEDAHPNWTLFTVIELICRELPPFPYGVSCPADKEESRQIRTRMQTYECLACGYTGRTTGNCAALGLPTCPCGTKMTGTWADELASFNQTTWK